MLQEGNKNLTVLESNPDGTEAKQIQNDLDLPDKITDINKYFAFTTSITCMEKGQFG